MAMLLLSLTLWIEKFCTYDQMAAAVLSAFSKFDELFYNICKVSLFFYHWFHYYSLSLCMFTNIFLLITFSFAVQECGDLCVLANSNGHMHLNISTYQCCLVQFLE